jgi:beta-galactosidase
MKGSLEISGAPADTFLRLDGFTKGFVTVNGFNIGRYFNSAGPQRTLYIPAPLLRQGSNEIIVFETDGFEKPVLTFTDVPDLG